MLFQLSYHFLVVFLITSIPTAFWVVLLKHWGRLPQPVVYIAALAAYAGSAYLVFWAFLAGRSTGLIFAYGTSGVSAICLVRWRKQLKDLLWADRELLIVHLFFFLIGLAYIGILCATPGPSNVNALYRSAHRFNDLPIDNVLPVMFADRLEANESVRHLFGEEYDAWLSSDRPPLQTGIVLSVRPMLMSPVFRLIGMRFGHTGFVASVWFQLFWIPAVWALLRTFGASIKQSATVIAITACTGFCLLYSIYTWPKFGAAALVIGGASIILGDRSKNSADCWTYTAGMFALAHLSHGGSDFALIALSFIVFIPALRPTIRECVYACLLFGIINVPWIAYQKFCDPPGNRLLKMHLAGVNDVDNRGVVATLTDRYRELGWTGFLQNKQANFSRLFEGDFKQIADFNFEPEAARNRRNTEFFFFFRTMSFGNVSVILSPFLLFWLARKASPDRMVTRKILYAYGWVILSLIAWCVLMFIPGSCVIHQGSLVPLLVVYSAAMLVVCRSSWMLFCLIACLQLASFLTTWVPANLPLGIAGDSAAYLVSGTCACGMALVTLLIKNQSVEPSVA